MTAHVLLQEFTFWIVFIVLNGFNYLLNYVLYYRSSALIPYLPDFLKAKKLGLVASVNQDPFRYAVEFSLVLIIARFIDFTSVSLLITTFYVVVLVFNSYQYLFRHIYNYEPNFYNDAKLLKTGISIVWHESKYKILLGLVAFSALLAAVYSLVDWYLMFSFRISSNYLFLLLLFCWAVPLIRSIQKYGFFHAYPNDIYLRYHFVIAELWYNIKRSIVNYRLTQLKIGQKFREARDNIQFTFKNTRPNIHLFFIESYGSYFFKEADFQAKAYDTFSHFRNILTEKGWLVTSNYSQSPTTAGQSWLTYSSFLYGIEIPNNTLFENYLHDKDFQESNNLLQILKNHGYTNYNLNPINPIKGINVPYEAMRKFYTIDHWILNDSLSYTGDLYGFGESPPDQYVMNETMEIIQSAGKKPYSFFYLTKNSHSPFISPKMVDNWKALNHQNGSTHIHKGFLKQPKKQDYFNSIQYQFENLSDFICSHGSEDDIFLVMGDHQPPILSHPDKHGFETPVHVISRNPSFIEGFTAYGFVKDLAEIHRITSHQALYSIFLRELIRNYGSADSQLPEYEENGLRL